MGTIREFGYREYADDLSPAKGGLSNLLFNPDRSLVTHADFHAVDLDEVSANEKSDVVVKALAVVGAVAVLYVTVKGVRYAVRKVRANRFQESNRTSGTEDFDQSSLTEDCLEHEAAVDADDALIEEVLALCQESTSTVQKYQGRPSAADEAPETVEAEPDASRKRAQLRSRR